MTRCPACIHARPDGDCGHPAVAPFEGEPPTRAGCDILDWLADRDAVTMRDPATGRVLVLRGADCPGRSRPGAA
jgi:hypothetical protein